MNFKNALVLPFIAGMLAGCASGGATINSKAMEAGAEPLKRVLVYYNAKSEYFSGRLYSSFVAATQRRIESCGVAVTTLEFDPLELDMRGKFTRAVEKADPDAVLVFLRDGANLVQSGGGISGTFYFNAEIKDKQRAKKLWMGRINYRSLTANLFTNDADSGEVFAAQFVSKLATDRVFSACPADVITPAAT